MLVWVSLAIAAAALLMFSVVLAVLRTALESVGHQVSDVLDREP
jgi:hypothetical protein